VPAGIRNLLRGSKDAAIALTIRTFINGKLRGIGHMTELSLDTKKRAFRARLELAGEAEPVEIHVRKYGLAENGDDATLTILDATASREWVSAALREFVVGRSFAIPAKAGAVLKLLG
jgi:hypothetical protein